MRLRRGFALVLLLTTLFMALSGAPVRAETIWQTVSRANALEQAGKIDQAMPLWRTLAESFGASGDYTNAAIFWKKLGKAYDDRNMRKEAIHAYEQENHYWTLAGYDWGKADMLRADQLRSSLQLYVAQPAAKLNRPLARHEPANGALIGFYSEQDRSVGNFFYKAEQAYGHPMAAALIYFTYGQSDIDTYLARAKEAGVGLQIAYQPLSGLQVVKDDAYLRSFARKLKESGLPIFLRFAGEMNGNWVPWASEPKQFIEKFRIVSKVMKEEAPNVAMVWAPGYVPDNYMPYYPGDEWVDWVGVSMYLDYYNNGNVKEPTDRASLLDMLKQITERFGDRKPIMIAEWGVANRDYTKRENHDAWAIANMERLLAGIPRKYPQVKALFYFMVDQGLDRYAKSVWSNYEFSTKPAIMSAYKQVVADPYFLTRMGKSAPVSYREIPAAGGPLEPGTQELSAVVKLYDPFVSKVEYLIDGRVIGSATKAPYTLKHDFRPYQGKQVKLTVRAYNSQGKVDEESTFPLTLGLTDQRPATAPAPAPAPAPTPAPSPVPWWAKP